MLVKNFTKKAGLTACNIRVDIFILRLSNITV